MGTERIERDDDVECTDHGHHWVPAGGGMLICARCQETRWDDERGRE